MSVVVRKDTTIWALIARLASVFGGDSFQLVDRWDADLFAIGIASAKDERRLVYVSTFGKTRGLFAYECEERVVGDSSRSTDRCEEADLDEIVRVVQRHLRMGSRSPKS